MFHNPYNVTNNVASRYETLHCTQERVYPLYSFVLIFYGFSLLFLLLFRPFVSAFFVQVIYRSFYKIIKRKKKVIFCQRGNETLAIIAKDNAQKKKFISILHESLEAQRIF